MKKLTTEEILWCIENCKNQDPQICNNCPLISECLYYYSGEECGSALEDAWASFFIWLSKKFLL